MASAYLSNDVVSSIVMTKRFNHNAAPINSIDFSADGELVVTSSDDESIHLYSCSSGELKNKVFSKKYGVDLIRFASQSKSHVITASKNGWDETIRYLSLLDNQYIRYFKGHRDKVVSFAVSSTDQTFVSGSLDSTIRLWDLRISSTQGFISNVPSRASPHLRTALAFDPLSITLAVGAADGNIKLYDKRYLDAGPCSVVNVALPPAQPPTEWRSVSFSSDGKSILISTNTNFIALIDSFTGDVVQTFTSFANEGSVLEASLSPNCNYVTSGSENGKLYVWNAKTGQEVAIWPVHKQPVRCVRWNPKILMLATGCGHTAFWTVSSEDE